MQPCAGTVTGSDLHHRFSAVLDGEFAAGDAGHARGCRGAVGEVDRGSVVLNMVDVLGQESGSCAGRWSNLCGDNEFT